MASRQNTETELKDTTPAENNTTNCNSQTLNNTEPSKPEKPMDQQPIKNTSAASRLSASPAETLDPALDPSSLPPPDPSLDTGNCSTYGDGVQVTPACPRDGNWFLKLLRAETARMEGWCQQMEQETKDNKLSEEGKWHSWRGQISSVMTQKKEKKQLLLLISLWVSFILAVTEPEQSIESIFTPFLAQNTTKAFKLIYLHGSLNMYEREAVKLQSLHRSSSSLWTWIINFHLNANIRQRISEQSFHVLFFLGFSMSHLNNYFTDTQYDDVNIHLLGRLSCNVFLLFFHGFTICSACFCLFLLTLASFLVLGTIRSAVGSAQLLISQKFEQFRGLCNENLVSFCWSTIPFYLHLFLLNPFVVQTNICSRFGAVKCLI